MSLVATEPVAKSFNQAVERDWPKVALFMAHGNLYFLGSSHVSWSAGSLPPGLVQ